MIIISFPQFFKFQCEEGCFTFVNNAGSTKRIVLVESCSEDVRRVYGRCTESVRRVYGRCSEGVRKAFGGCTEVFRGCTEGVRKYNELD